VLQYCFPTVRDHCETSAVLEVLHSIGGGRRWVRDRRSERAPGDGQLAEPTRHRRRLDADDVVHRGNDVRHEDELVALRTALGLGHARRPVQNHRHVHATFMSVLLVPAIRGVAALRPTPGVVRVAVGAADVVDAGDRFVWGLENPVEELHLVHHAERASLLRSAVVCQHEDHRVVELPKTTQPLDEASDLNVGVIEERRKCLLQAACEELFVVRQRVPRLDTRVAGRQHGVWWNHPQFELPTEPSSPG